MRQLTYVEGEASRERAAIAADLVRGELEKILGSGTFNSAKRLQDFLRYTVSQSLEGRSDLLKEYSIGIDVFGRGNQFDPRLDPIVRVRAWQLRARLAKYYETEGADDALRIEFHKGSYVPHFTSVVGTPSRTDCSRPLAPHLSIAVLPFLARGETRADEVFSEGLTDELIGLLGRIPDLQVAARTSVFQFKGQPLDIRVIGHTLNVRMVLEGSVRRHGRTLRITFQLIDATTGFQLWSGTHESTSDDELAIQRDVAARIARALGVRLAQRSASPSSMLPETHAASSQVFQLCVQGRHFAAKETAGNLKRAIDCFERAMACDPRYAPAFSGLAHSYARIANFTTIASRDIVPKIRTAAHRALELDETVGEAHLALASASVCAFDWSAADSEFNRGIALCENDASAHWQYGAYLLKTGRLDEALSARKRAFDLDPVSADMALGVGMPLLSLAHNDEAIEWFQAALDLDPHFGLARRGLAHAYLQQGFYERGLTELKQAYQLLEADCFTTGELGYAYALCGDKHAAEKLLSKLLALGSPAVPIARVYIGLGETSRAFDYLQNSVDQHEVYLFLHCDAIYDPLRGDARFTQLLKQMDLPAEREFGQLSA